MACVRHKILVLSGKGGVGKSTFTAHLAHGLAGDENTQVGCDGLALALANYLSLVENKYQPLLCYLSTPIPSLPSLLISLLLSTFFLLPLLSSSPSSPSFSLLSFSSPPLPPTPSPPPPFPSGWCTRRWHLWSVYTQGDGAGGGAGPHEWLRVVSCSEWRNKQPLCSDHHCHISSIEVELQWNPSITDTTCS